VSYGPLLRDRLEAVLCGEAGTTRVMAAGRFHRRVPDRQGADVDLEPPAVAERSVEAVVGDGAPFVENNPYDGFGLFEHAVTIRVSYALTHAGGDVPEGLTAQHGAGTLDAIRARSVTDAADIDQVLGWPENWQVAGGDPHVIDLEMVRGRPPGFAPRGDVAVLEIPFRLVVRARLDATAYATAPA
jgi:hypothetical protein